MIPVRAEIERDAEPEPESVLASIDHPAAAKTVVGITIPEPSTLGLVGLTLLLITSRHRARRFGKTAEFSGPRSF